MLTDIAPNWSEVDCIIPPQDVIHKLNEGEGGSPEDVQNTSDIPGCGLLIMMRQ